MLPPSTRQGVLPPGTYEMTIAELRSSSLVVGPAGVGPGWDAKWRRHLVDNIGILAEQLWSIGITEIFDGSFVDDKDRPNDIDGYFVCSISDQVNRILERKLNAIDHYRVWGWDDHMRHQSRKLPMWHRYRVDLWPYAPGTVFGFDDHGRPLELSEAFRRTKNRGIVKGIVKLKVSGT